MKNRAEWEAVNTLMTVPEGRRLGHKGRRKKNMLPCARSRQCLHEEPGIPGEKLAPSVFLAEKFVKAVKEEMQACTEGRRFLLLWHAPSELLPEDDIDDVDHIGAIGMALGTNGAQHRFHDEFPGNSSMVYVDGDLGEWASQWAQEALLEEAEGSGPEIGLREKLRSDGLAFHIGDTNMISGEEELRGLRMEANDVPVPAAFPSEWQEKVIGLSSVLEYPEGFGPAFEVYSQHMPDVREQFPMAVEALEKWGDDDVWIEFGHLVESPAPLASFALNEQWCRLGSERVRPWKGARQEERYRAIEKEKRRKEAEEKRVARLRKAAEKRKAANEKRKAASERGIVRISTRKQGGKGQGKARKRKRAPPKGGGKGMNKPQRKKRKPKQKSSGVPTCGGPGVGVEEAIAKEEEYEEHFDLVPEMDDGDGDGDDPGPPTPDPDHGGPAGGETGDDGSGSDSGPDDPPGPTGAPPPPVVTGT